MPVALTFPDGSVREYPSGVTGRTVASDIGPRLADAAVAVALDGAEMDLERPIETDGGFAVITDTTDAGRAVLRHSAAHVLAQAVLDLYPGAAFAIGPPITDGFYYDFDIGRPFTPEDLEEIEGRMAEIIASDQPFIRESLSIERALELFADQPFKTEIIEGVEAGEGVDEGVVTVYRNNGFVDLCRGPHVPSHGSPQCGAPAAHGRRLLAGRRAQRPAAEDLRHGLGVTQSPRCVSRAARAGRAAGSSPARHRARSLLVPSGVGQWPRRVAPEGRRCSGRSIEDYSRRTHEAFDYEYVVSPHVAKADLWETSGHVDFYADAMYPAMELDHGQRYIVKPMNCPFHILIYKSRSRSYRELPLRLFELGTVYRYERSGVVHGLLRARGFTQDDSHIFTTVGQLADELQNLLDFVLMVLRDFGFEEFEADLSTGIRRSSRARSSCGIWPRRPSRMP